MFKTYAVVKPNGRILSFCSYKVADALGIDSLVQVDNPNLKIGDRINKTTGDLIEAAKVNTQESRAECRERVRTLLRDSDWTQTTDNLGVGKQQAWATYRAELRANWNTAKGTSDPLVNMVWPIAPGDPSDGL